VEDDCSGEFRVLRAHRRVRELVGHWRLHGCVAASGVGGAAEVA